MLREAPDGLAFYPTPDDEPVTGVALDAVRALTSHEVAVIEAARAGDVVGSLDALDRHRMLCAHRAGPRGVRYWSDAIERWLVAEDPLLTPRLDGRYAGQPLLVTANDYDNNLYKRRHRRGGAARQRSGGGVSAWWRRTGDVAVGPALRCPSSGTGPCASGPRPDGRCGASLCSDACSSAGSPLRRRCVRLATWCLESTHVMRRASGDGGMVMGRAPSGQVPGPVLSTPPGGATKRTGLCVSGSRVQALIPCHTAIRTALNAMGLIIPGSWVRVPPAPHQPPHRHPELPGSLPPCGRVRSSRGAASRRCSGRRPRG
jgi:hypothetical protein